jgi:ribonuclease HII
MKIAGIDEVGRGAIAGDVYMAMVVLDSNFPLFTHHTNSQNWTNKFQDFKKVRDSKKLPEKTREVVKTLVLKNKIIHFYLFATPAQIDDYGIGVCLSHFIYIFINLYPKAKFLIDGKIKILDNYNPILIQKIIDQNQIKVPLKFTPTLSLTPNKSEITVIRENKADDKYLSIALASNLAKVERDSKMKALDKEFPMYNWSKNKGYGTAKHRIEITINNDNKHLRKTFLSKILDKKNTHIET